MDMYLAKQEASRYIARNNLKVTHAKAQKSAEKEGNNCPPQTWRVNRCFMRIRQPLNS